MNDYKIGIAFKLANVALYSFASVLTKFLLPSFGVFQILLIKSICGLGILHLIKHKELPKDLSPNIIYIARGATNALGMLLWIYSIQNIPISIATSLSALIPIFTTILAIYFLKERMTYKIFGALTIGLIGFLILLKPTATQSWLGISAAVGSALMWAIHDTIAKYQSSTDPWTTQAFYTYVVSVTITIVPAVIYWQEITFTQLSYITIISSILVLNIFCLVQALRRVPLVFLSPLLFCRFIITALLAFMILNESTDKFSWFGTMLIIIATTMIIYAKKE